MLENILENICPDYQRCLIGEKRLHEAKELSTIDSHAVSCAGNRHEKFLPQLKAPVCCRREAYIREKLMYIGKIFV